MAFLTKYKTYLAGAGLLGLAVYQLSQGQIEGATGSLFAGLTAIGLRHETAPTLVASNVQFAPRPIAKGEAFTYETYNK